MISVIIPVYNVENYLRECLDSVLGQSFTDFEVLLVDDGSTDGSGAICDEYAAKDQRIRLIRQENKGLSGARNTGIEAACGDYLSFVDSDDRIHRDFLSVLYRACTENDCRMAVCDVATLKEDAAPDAPDADTEMPPVRIEEAKDLLEEFYGPRHIAITVAWNKLYHRSVLEGVRYPQGFVYEDEATTFACIYNAGKLAWAGKALYGYRNRSGSITKSGFSLKRLDVLEAYRRRRQFYTEKGEKQLASREEYCYLSELLKFYDKLGRFLPEEKEKRRELLNEYRKCHAVSDKKGWGFKRRAFYRISRIFPSLYGKMKG